MTANPAPGFRKRPDHPIVMQPAGVRVQVRAGGTVIADSRDALVMKEGDYPPVYYFPRADVSMDRLVRSNHTTYCPFKGAASYFSLREGAADAVWSYEAPYDEMSAIRDRLAFYPEKVDSIIAG
jgi:uncharacterized protein (DUF427 family)